jgi:hypothetical protein
LWVQPNAPFHPKSHQAYPNLHRSHDYDLPEDGDLYFGVCSDDFQIVLYGSVSFVVAQGVALRPMFLNAYEDLGLSQLDEGRESPHPFALTEKCQDL